jgi:Dolichyl-phosphate-mannose-protein mannosyltransferase
MPRERLIFWFLLAASFAIRAIHPGQPIVENYVGRQIPTAMVARNLERGSGFLHPQLNTGPFPNLFLVEPPIYAQVVVLIRPILGFELEATGRLVSASATVLGAWGLFGLVRRREGPTVALLALASFGFFPVMIRYGRAFQPDALMLGCVLAGLRGWDEYEAGGSWRWAAFGGFVLATGLALKITVVWVLIPFVLIVRRWPIGWRLATSAVMLVPTLAWYLTIWGDLARPGSSASSDNASLWLRSLSPEAWLRLATFENLTWGLVVQSFTPVGFVLAMWGLMASGKVDRLWQGWAIGCSLSILGLAAKWHHAYYWMVVAPLASVGVARGLASLARMRRFGMPLAATLASSFLALCLVQSASTWRTPVEWASLPEAARVLATSTTEDQLIIAPEAVLHYSGRRGYRLEFDPAACRRAAGEWGYPFAKTDRTLGLTEFYWNLHSITEDFLLAADVGLTAEDARRRAWREAIRKRGRTRIIADRPGFMIAELR